MRLMPLLILLLLPRLSLALPQKSVTLYLDGARVELEESARDGYLELALPSTMLPGSLRVRPVAGGSVLRVELKQGAPDRQLSRERERLAARRGELEDRLKALAVREEVFFAAARSQSGKSPRKTKTNPDPLGSLRQGTEFALGQLEVVYRSRRRCQAQLAEIDRELALSSKEGVTARVWLSGRRARLCYLTAAQRWTPCYSFRLDGAGQGELLLHAKLPPAEKGAHYLVALGALAAPASAQKASGELGLLARYPLTLSRERYTEAPYPALSFAFKGGEGWLPPGEAAIFWRGAYLGSGRFAGGAEGEISSGAALQ